MMPIALALGAALVGLCAGSFIATAVIRAAVGADFIAGRSRCDGCGRVLPFSQTLPVWSYATQRGSAACCSAKIDPLHLVGEVAGGMIALTAIGAGDLFTGLVLAALGAILLALALTDLKTGRLPDRLVAAAAILSLIAAAVHGADSLMIGILAAAVSFLILEGVRRAFLRLRKRGGLGFGDVKLITAVALTLGALTPIVVVLASVLGLLQVLVLRPSDGRIVFGPAIAAAAFATLAVQSIPRFSL